MNSKQAKEAPNNLKITIIAKLSSPYSRLKITSQDANQHTHGNRLFGKDYEPRVAAGIV